jgi:hypothetical protein
MDDSDGRNISKDLGLWRRLLIRMSVSQIGGGNNNDRGGGDVKEAE